MGGIYLEGISRSRKENVTEKGKQGIEGTEKGRQLLDAGSLQEDGKKEGLNVGFSLQLLSGVLRIRSRRSMSSLGVVSAPAKVTIHREGLLDTERIDMFDRLLGGIQGIPRSDSLEGTEGAWEFGSKLVWGPCCETGGPRTPVAGHWVVRLTNIAVSSWGPEGRIVILDSSASVVVRDRVGGGLVFDRRT